MKYAIFRHKDTWHIAERRQVGIEGRDDAEVYESIGTANSVQDADRIVSGMNAANQVSAPRMERA